MSVSIFFFGLMLMFGAFCTNSQSGVFSTVSGVLSLVFFCMWICAAIVAYNPTLAEEASREAYLHKKALKRQR